MVTALSPWEQFLTGKKVPASRFLAKVEAARTKGGISLPDEETKIRFAEAIKAKPARIARLVGLLQACATCSDTERQIVLEFAHSAIKRLGVVTFPEPLDATSFNAVVSSWLAGIRKKPIRPSELNLHFLFLQFGWHRQLLDETTAFTLVASAVSKPSRKPTKLAEATKPPQTAAEVLLAAMPTIPVLSSLLAHAEVLKAAVEERNGRIQSQAEEIARSATECAALNAAVSGLQSEIAILRHEKGAAETNIMDLEKRIVDLCDGYQHKLDDLRGRIRGVLQGQITRWLQTALDASRSDPPWTQAIQERLEDALKLIEKEIQCLQPSA